MNEQDTRFYKIIGKKIRQLRTEKGMTLLDLAAKLNLTSKTVQRYETGERRINVIRLKNLIEILDYNYDDFMREVQYEQITDMPSGPKKGSGGIDEKPAKFHEKDFEKILGAAKEQILSQDEILISEQPVSKEDIVSIFDAMSVALEIVKRKNMK